MDINIRIGTGIKARNGDEIFLGDKVETIQGTLFTIVLQNGKFYMETNGCLYEFKPYMSPNLWIVN